jgi:thiamine transport system permease protein
MTKRAALGLAAVPIAFLVAFFAWPVASILGVSFRQSGSSGIDLGVVWFTAWQALASTAITLAVGLPIAGALSRYEFRGSQVIRALTLVPFVLPTLVVGVAFLALIGPSGALGIDLSGTPAAIIATHVFFNTAVVVRIVGAMWAHIDRRLEDSARILGAGHWKSWWSVTFPLLRPAIASAAAIVFLFSFTSFGTVLVLGGPRLATIEVDIYRRAIGFDLRGAAVLALVQMAGVVAALSAYARYQRRSGVRQSLSRSKPERPGTRGQKLYVLGAAGGAIVLAGGPIAALVWRAILGGSGLDLSGFEALASSPFVDVGSATASSIGFALAATLIGLGVGLPAAILIAEHRGRLSQWFDTLLLLPLGTSAVTLGFGLLVALDWPVDLRASWIIIPIAHSLVALPFVVRSMAPVLGSIRGRLREAAAVLGASPWRTRREVDLPIAARAGLIATGFAFVISLGEFGATTFLARPGSRTLPLAIYLLQGRPGDANLRAAMLLSLFLVAITATVVLAIDRTRLPGRELF